MSEKDRRATDFVAAIGRVLAMMPTGVKFASPDDYHAVIDAWAGSLADKEARCREHMALADKLLKDCTAADERAALAVHNLRKATGKSR